MRGRSLRKLLDISAP
ncbi:BgTH12-00359 [Blumeria graminis f. sp. triticale]|uniref:BgTH12-00359 n=1 Tax=Blumeria graminis f. sp. triticale TaxID=1689686 RepID=A0A9W4DAG8_BLUGR|nr:BgTH12-00359 [Blumeria graminis f. sp. triticale]